MRVSIVVVCVDRWVLSVLGEQRERAIPAHYRSSSTQGFEVSLTPIDAAGFGSQAGLMDAIEKIGEDATAIILMIPRVLRQIVSSLADAIFVYEYDHIPEGASVPNQMAASFKRAITKFGAVLRRFNDLQYRRTMLLPLETFSSPHVAQLRVLLQDPNNDPDFNRSLDRLLKEVRDNHQRPLRFGQEVTITLHDAASRIYTLGKERHAKAETGCPPHDPACGLNAHLRFGCRYDKDWHFNVEEPRQNMKMVRLPGCHHQGQQSPRSSHANVFPNDYVT